MKTPGIINRLTLALPFYTSIWLKLAIESKSLYILLVSLKTEQQQQFCFSCAFSCGLLKITTQSYYCMCSYTCNDQVIQNKMIKYELL